MQLHKRRKLHPERGMFTSTIMLHRRRGIEWLLASHRISDSQSALLGCIRLKLLCRVCSADSWLQPQVFTGKLMHRLVLHVTIPPPHTKYLGIAYFEVSNADRSSALGLRLNQQNKKQTHKSPLSNQECQCSRSVFS